MNTEKILKGAELLGQKKIIENRIKHIEKALNNNEITFMSFGCNTISNIVLKNDDETMSPLLNEFIYNCLECALMIYKAKLSELNILIMSL